MAITDTVPEYEHFDARRELLILLRTLTTPISISNLLATIENAEYTRAQQYKLITKLSFNLKKLEREHILDVKDEHITLHYGRFMLELQAYNIFA